MGSFTDGVWNLIIIVCTVGSIYGLFFFTHHFSKSDSEPSADDSTGHVWDEDLRELNNPLPKWWLNLFYITLAFGMGYLLLYPGLGLNPMLLGWTQIKQYEQEMAEADQRYGPLFERHLNRDIEELRHDPEALRIGERLYASYCTGCHGSDASGGPGFPNLTDADWLYGGTPAAIETSILDGRNAMMPPWAAVLGGEEEVRKMASYVTVIGTGQGENDTHQGARTKFQTFCVACHQADGSGNQALGAPNLTDDIWLYGASVEAITESIANGRQGSMPPHRNFLGEAKAHLVAAYVYSLSEH